MATLSAGLFAIGARSRWRLLMTLGGFPLSLALSGLAQGVAAALWLLCKPSGEPTLPISWVLARKVGLCVGALLAYALLFEPLGFVLSTALAGFSLGLLFGGRLLPSALSGLLMGTLLYGLFDYLLDVPLLLGLFAAFVES